MTTPASPPSRRPHDTETAAATGTLSASVRAELAHQIAAGHCPGALTHVERDGQVQVRMALGRVRPDLTADMPVAARFRIASLTKPVVTVGALMLVDEGRLALDAAVADWLPELGDLRLADGARPEHAMTVRDLMRHTAGFAYPFEIPDASVRQAWLEAGFTPAMAGLDAAGFLSRLARLPLVAEPGTRFRYGYSTDVLGLLIERIEGRTLGEVLRQRLFEPLGMAHTGFVLDPAVPEDHVAAAFDRDAAWHATIPPIGQRPPSGPWMDSGGGGLVSTLDDYAAFARMLAHGGVSQGRRLLSERAMADLFTQQLPDGVDGPGSYCGPGFGFGLGLALRQATGPAAMPVTVGEGAWSGISGTALFVQPRTRWFALLFSANMGTRMLSRMAFRHALGSAADD